MQPLPLPKDVAGLYIRHRDASQQRHACEATVNYFRRRGCPVHPVTHVIPVPTGGLLSPVSHATKAKDLSSLELQNGLKPSWVNIEFNGAFNWG